MPGVVDWATGLAQQHPGAAAAVAVAAVAAVAVPRLLMGGGKLVQPIEPGKPKRVVILGAGYGGTSVANELDKHPAVDVTVIDRRDYMVHKIGGLRAAVQDDWRKKVVIPRHKLLTRGKVIRGNVKEVAKDHVLLDDGTKVPFDILVCATGSVNASPGEPSANEVSLEQMNQFFQATSAAVSRSTRVAIIGGGSVGVELAGEIRHAYPDKPIVLVHASPKLLSSAAPALPDSFQTKIKSQLAEVKIDTYLDAHADLAPADFNGKPFLEGKRTIKLSTGEEVTADLIFNCMGNKLATSIYPAEWLDERGAVKVEPTMQVQGASNVFALGDITNLVENKMAYIAGSVHTPVVAANVLALAVESKPTHTHTPSDKSVMLVPLGADYGVTVTPIGTFGSFLSSRLKGRSLFVDKTWASNNLPVPLA